jgi:acid phosphatase
MNAKMGRRAFLVGGAAFGGSLLLLTRREDDALREGPSRTIGARVLPPPEDPLAKCAKPRMSVFALGDTGWQTEAKLRVAAAMAEKARITGLDFVLLLGDTFYRDGVDSTSDARWKTQFEDSYAAPELQVPFFAALGNHDHNGNVQAQVEYSAQSERWRMPGQYYAFSRWITPECEVQFFVLDTTTLRLDSFTAHEQTSWLGEKLAGSTASWKIVIGHHPLISGGDHGGSSTVRDRIEPLLVAHDVDLYLSGHDHDLQLLKTGHRYLQAVSGRCMTRDVR